MKKALVFIWLLMVAPCLRAESPELVIHSSTKLFMTAYERVHITGRWVTEHPKPTSFIRINTTEIKCLRETASCREALAHVYTERELPDWPDWKRVRFGGLPNPTW